MISVLFTQKNSIYNKFLTDTWDITRDARNWPGGNPIIAHPPCRAWGNYSHWAKPRPGEKELAIWAIDQIRTWGGVLEHPETSKLWIELDLPTPGETDLWGGFTLSIDQSWFDHRAIKRTFLYIVGTTPKNIPPIQLSLNAREFTPIEQMAKNERERTPEPMAKWLIQLAEIIDKNQKEQERTIRTIKNKII